MNDAKIIQAMRVYGGGFVSALAEAATRADADNLQRLKDAFPDYWRQYEEMAEQVERNRSSNW